MVLHYGILLKDGPLARVDLRDELHEQVEKTIKQGGKLVVGGNIPEQKGAYYPATILADLKPGMEAFDEELFGANMTDFFQKRPVEYAKGKGISADDLF
mgnify:CR=1 FL=1